MQATALLFRKKKRRGLNGPAYRLRTGFVVTMAFTVEAGEPLYPGSPGNLGVYPPGTGVGDTFGFIEILGTVGTLATTILVGVLVACTAGA